MGTKDESSQDGHIHDVLIVGAGPGGLAVAARLREPLPGAQFTSDEHQRYHWIRKHGRHAMTIKDRRSGAVKVASSHSSRSSQREHFHADIDMLVLDEEGDEWMTRWNRLFKAFGIHTLRSPMFFHLDPGDRDGLLAYAYMQGREKELVEIRGAVGKELSKHQRKKRTGKRSIYTPNNPVVDERERNDYFRPSTPLFHSHCTDVTDRYHLGNNLINQASVQDIVYGFSPLHPESDKIFTVRSDKDTHYARIVVLAVGPANKPCIPGLSPEDRMEGACHTMHIRSFPSSNVKDRIKAGTPTSVLIVGGGLTSAQIAEKAVASGISKVYLIMRGPVKVKHFDMDLDWVGKFRNQKQAAFWSADSHAERLEMYLQARDGGSMNPTYKRIVEKLNDSERLSLMTFTTIASKVWDSYSQQWTVTVTTRMPRPKPKPDTVFDEEQETKPVEETTTLPPIDYIYFATGVETNHATLPFLQSMNRDYPIPSAGGYPCITDDMMWRKDVPMFVTGRLAALQLGPGAPNLIGCRTGAERIAWNILEILNGGKTGSEDASFHTHHYEGENGNRAGRDDGAHADREFSYRTGRGNMFESLEQGDSDE